MKNLQHFYSYDSTILGLDGIYIPLLEKTLKKSSHRRSKLTTRQKDS